MKFEHALMEFLLKLKEEYGMMQMIKSIELNEEIYRCVEWDLLQKTSTIEPFSTIKFYYYNEVIDIKRNEQRCQSCHSSETKN